MIRNDKEYRNSQERLGELRASLEEIVHATDGRGVQAEVVDAIRMQVEDVEREVGEYEDLKAGRLLAFEAHDLDSLGELMVKARIA